MQVRDGFYCDCLFYSSYGGGSDHAFFFFHGFPSNTGKNEDLACHLASNYDVHLMHYAGLGKSCGRFSFLGAINDAVAFVNHVNRKKNYRYISLLGHSFGGYVSICVANELGRVENLVLLAPVLEVPAPEVVVAVVEEFRAEQEGYSAQELCRSVEAVRGIELNAAVCSDIYVLHGKRDEVLNPVTTREIIQRRKMAVTYEEPDADHWFTDYRTELMHKISSWLDVRQAGG